MKLKEYPWIIQNLFTDETGGIRESHMVDEHHVQVRFFGHDYKQHEGAELAISLLEKLTAAGWLIRREDGFHTINLNPPLKAK